MVEASRSPCRRNDRRPLRVRRGSGATVEAACIAARRSLSRQRPLPPSPPIQCAARSSPEFNFTPMMLAKLLGRLIDDRAREKTPERRRAPTVGLCRSDRCRGACGTVLLDRDDRYRRSAGVALSADDISSRGDGQYGWDNTVGPDGRDGGAGMDGGQPPARNCVAVSTFRSRSSVGPPDRPVPQSGPVVDAGDDGVADGPNGSRLREPGPILSFSCRNLAEGTIRRRPPIISMEIGQVGDDVLPAAFQGPLVPKLRAGP